MGLRWETGDLACRPMATAAAEHVGQFIWSEYWAKWDEVLGCEASADGRSLWTVRELDTTRVRRHGTPVPLDCIHVAPDVDGGRHVAPLALPNLAVLRAGMAGEGLRNYFGSHLGFGFWLADTQRRGLVDEQGRATAAGRALGCEIKLAALPEVRAALWPGASQLVQRAAYLARRFSPEASPAAEG